MRTYAVGGPQGCVTMGFREEPPRLKRMSERRACGSSAGRYAEDHVRHGETLVRPCRSHNPGKRPQARHSTRHAQLLP